jgi:hypothetical protein
VVVSLLLVVAAGKAHGCTVATAAIVVAGSAAIKVGAVDPRVGYTPYDSLEEHR